MVLICQVHMITPLQDRRRMISLNDFKSNWKWFEGFWELNEEYPLFQTVFHHFGGVKGSRISLVLLFFFQTIYNCYISLNFCVHWLMSFSQAWKLLWLLFMSNMKIGINRSGWKCTCGLTFILLQSNTKSCFVGTFCSVCWFCYVQYM